MTMMSIIRYSIVATMLSVVSVSVNAAAWITDSAGGFSQVNLYVPETQSPIGEGRSLLIVLHGCAQSISDFRTANLEIAAEEFGMVIAVPDAENKAGYACWDYWGGAKSRYSGDYKNLINLAQEYTANSDLDIDPNQVYISGVSAGGTFAMTTWCLAPDVFAGVAAVGSPAVGGSSDGFYGIPPMPEDTARKCKTYAGGYTDYFLDQKVSIAHGTNDYTVDQSYGPHNAKAMAIVLDLENISEVNNIDGIATETLWSDEGELSFISQLELEGVGNAWPGGSGASSTQGNQSPYIDNTNINYAMYLGEFFSSNKNRPEKCKIDISGFEVADPFVPEADNVITVTGTVEISGDCTLNSIDVSLDEEKRKVNGPYISEDYVIAPGEHMFSLEVDVMEEDGNSYITTWNMSFTSESPEPVIPSWCHYYPKLYWKWFPSCAAGL